MKEDFSNQLKVGEKYKIEGIKFKLVDWFEKTPEQAKQELGIESDGRRVFGFVFDTPFQEDYTVYLRDGGDRTQIANSAKSKAFSGVKDRLMDLYNRHKKAKNKDNIFINKNNRDKDPYENSKPGKSKK